MSTSSALCVCMCVCEHTHTHTNTQKTPAEKWLRIDPGRADVCGQLRGRAIDQPNETRTNVDDWMMLVRQCSCDYQYVMS